MPQARADAASTCPGDSLVEYSPGDRPWDVHKAQAVVMAHALRDIGYEAWAKRVDACAETLWFGWADGVEGTSALRLRQAHFCRCPACPTCKWRRSMKWKARFYEAVPLVLETAPKARWLLLTLTVRNCPIDELGATLTAMGAAWKRLLARREFIAVYGWIRTTEVTRGADDSAHPHYHVLMLVSSSWFGRHYVTQQRWTELWQECMRIDYQPMVDVRTVKRGRRRAGAEGGIPGELAAAAVEVLKYATKATDLLGVGGSEGCPQEPPQSPRSDDRSWLLEYLRQTYRRHFIAAGGVLADVLRTDDDFIHTGDDDQAMPDDGSRLAFDYDRKPKHYRRAPDRDRARQREPGDDDE